MRRVRPAPTYSPSAEEWADPLAYIRSIQGEAARFGICKIVPPASADVPAGLVGGGGAAAREGEWRLVGRGREGGEDGGQGRSQPGGVG